MTVGIRVGLKVGCSVGTAVGIPNDRVGGSQPQLIGIFGQSSAIGRGNVNTDVSVATPAWTAAFNGVTLRQLEGTHVDPPVTVYDDTRVLQPRTWNDALVNQGTELSMGRYLYAVKPGLFTLVKWGIGGCGLQEGFTPSSTYPSTGGNALARAIAYFQNAERQLGGKMVCFVFIGCETDALTTGPASAVQANMAAMLASLRTTWPSVPLVFNELTSALPIGTYPFRDTVRTQQVAFLGASTNVSMVNGDDLPIDSGSHEYVGDSLLTLGNRIGLSVLGRLGIDILPVANFSVSTNALVATFTDTSSDVDGSVTGWAWNFGDGGTSTAQNPVHSYPSSGVYTVKLTVTDNVGGQNSITSVLAVATPTWTVDTLASKGTPANTAEWASFGQTLPTKMGAPAHGYQFNEASGNIIDNGNVGGKNLTVGGAPVYQVAVTGYTRKSIGPSGAASNQTAANNTMENLSTTSVLVYGLILLNSTTAQPSRIFHGAGSVNDFQAQANTDMLRLRNSVAANGLIGHSGSVHPFLLKYDRTNLVNALYTDKEKVSVAYNAAAVGSSLTVQFGTSLDAASSTQFLQLAQWNGADAEQTDANLKSFLTMLSWAVSGW